MKLRPISAAILLLAATLTTASVHAEAERRSYIVQLTDKPVATYTGQVTGLAATMPAQGQRLDVDAADVQAYMSYLDTKQSAVINTVNAAEITHKYDVVFNGFAAMLTDDEVRALKKNSGVAAITADSIMEVDTSYTPAFLGLDQPGGLWEQLGGKGLSGENIVVGILDGGIWPENPSYADRVDGDGNPSHSGSTVVYDAPPASWKGSCDLGEGFGANNCNNKLIGARYFKQPALQLHWTEFLSARDSVAGTEGRGGHGSHTSSTAAGNAGVTVLTDGINLGKVSGMAPRARIAAYKVCWTDAATGKNGCATANSVAAINQAVKDGVNVINFSIGSSAGGGSFAEATEQAFLGATAAGVFVATSAGNQGPGATAPAPVGHISPWLASVGNSTHNRLYLADAVTGSGVALTGASSNANTPTAPLVLAKDAGLPGADVTQLNRCYGATDAVPALLDPAKVAGKIVVCDRGGNVLVNKSGNAKVAGAVGVIIANVEGSATTVVNQAHTISTVHIAKEKTAILKSYIAANPATAVASLGNLRASFDPSIRAPVMNATSSRGPNVANANILKPDMTAPGTDILAAVTGSGVALTGASSNANTPTAPLVLAKDAGLPGADVTQLNRCYGATDAVPALLDPAKVAGKIVVCDRGGNVLVNTSGNAKVAGAVGVIIANIEGSATTVVNQAHTISTVHIAKEKTAILKSYIAANPAAAVASLVNLRASFDPSIRAPVMNASSSRGPNVANANILKPDMTAPGTDILAAVTADLSRTQRDAVAAGAPAPVSDWAFYTGTSMASPHVAGVAALLKQLHPTWTPAAIKSALMTTATDTLSDGLTTKVAWDSTATNAGTLPWGQGAGHIAPNSAANPGLVYDIAPNDYARFLCGQGLIYTSAQCTALGGSLAAYNLNLASLTAGNVLGSLTMTRTVTNVGPATATYNATASLPGFAVTVQPSTLVLAAGAKASFTVKLTRTSAPLDTWAYGVLNWTDGSHNVRSPLTARGSGLSAPASVVSEAASGSKVVTVGTGFAGAMSAVKGGLLPATRESRAIGTANTNLSNTALCQAGNATGVSLHPVTIPAGTLLARFSLFDADTTGAAAGTSDLDLVLMRGNTAVASSGSDTSNESVQVVAPAAGDYSVCVIGFSPAGGQATYALSSWVVQPSTAGNFKVNMPSSATVGGTATVGMSWSGLAVGKRHLGAVNYLVGGVKQGMTVVEVDTTDPLPLFKNSRNKEALAF
ncbi:MAG TPA: S8 family serine peptidase [Duganella sp.]